MEQTHAIPPQQAKALAELLAANNATFQALVSYFGAVLDGLGLSRESRFVSVDPDTSGLVIEAPE